MSERMIPTLFSQKPTLDEAKQVMKNHLIASVQRAVDSYNSNVHFKLSDEAHRASHFAWTQYDAMIEVFIPLEKTFKCWQGDSHAIAQELREFKLDTLSLIFAAQFALENHWVPEENVPNDCSIRVFSKNLMNNSFHRVLEDILYDLLKSNPEKVKEYMEKYPNCLPNSTN